MSLLEAVENDDFKAVQELILKGANVNEKNLYGKTPLLLAMEKSKQIISLLINVGADVNAMDHFGCTALDVAIKNNDSYLVKLLLSNGAQNDIKNIDGQISLHFVTFYSKNDSHFKVCEILIENNVDINAEDYGRNTPLLILLKSRADNHKICKFLIEQGANVNTKNRSRNTPLHEAVKSKKLYAVRLLLSQGAQVNAKNKYGRTSLHEATYTSNLKACKLLLKYKANINSRNNVGKTPLHLLSSKNKKKSCTCICKLLIKKGANVNAKDKNGRTPLHEAVSVSENDIHLRVCEELLLGNANPNAETKSGKTPLYLLSKKKTANNKIFKLLIENGADVNFKSKCRRTVLHWAVINNQGKMIELLLAEGAQADEKDGKNRTPLHEALSRSENDSHSKVCELLLEKIAIARSNDDKITLDIFSRSILKNLQMTNLLQKYYSPKINNYGISLGSPQIFTTGQAIIDEEKYTKIGQSPPCNSFRIKTLAYEVAMARDDASSWKIAMENEIKVLEEKNTWSLCTLPVGKSVLKCKWIFTVETDKSYRARLTARTALRPVKDLYGTPYIIKSLLSEAAKRDYEMIKFEVKTGILQGTLKEEIYLEQPPGFINPDQPKAVYKLNRSFRGLDPSILRWNKLFHEFLERFEFKCIDSKMKHVFIGEVNKFIAYLILYLDSGLILCERTREGTILMDYLKHVFDIDAQMVNNLQTDELFGVEIFRDRENCSIKLSQSQYAKEVLRCFENLGSKIEEKVPVYVDWYEQKTVLEKIEFPMKEIVTSLRCLSRITRPDIEFAVNNVSQFSDNPDRHDWEAVKMILRYLKTTWNYAIVYSRRKIDFDIQVNTTVTYCPISKLSRSGYVLTLNGGPVFWSSRLMSNGYEYGNELLFYDVFHNLKFYFAPIKLYTNSKSNYITQLVQEKKVILEQDEETVKLANIFVRPLNEKDFTDIRSKLSILPI